LSEPSSAKRRTGDPSAVCDIDPSSRTTGSNRLSSATASIFPVPASSKFSACGSVTPLSDSQP